MKTIYYKGGYKYQLADGYMHNTAIHPKQTLSLPFVELLPSGWLVIMGGFAWDGPSGLTFDTKSSMRASLVHDALYRLMRAELLDAKAWRPYADKLMYQICLQDGMWGWRAYLWWRAVARLGWMASDPESRKRTHEAP